LRRWDGMYAYMYLCEMQERERGRWRGQFALTVRRGGIVSRRDERAPERDRKRWAYRLHELSEDEAERR